MTIDYFTTHDLNALTEFMVPKLKKEGIFGDRDHFIAQPVGKQPNKTVIISEGDGSKYAPKFKGLIEAFVHGAVAEFEEGES